MRLLALLCLLPLAMSTNSSQIIVVQGFEPDVDTLIGNVTDIPRHLKTGRPHCFNSPNLYCSKNRKCCTHVHQKKIWCCERKHKCGKAPLTCVVPTL